MYITGSGAFIAEATAFTGSSNQIKVSIRLPAETEWMDCTQGFLTNQWDDGDGSLDGDGGLINEWWNLTVGSKSTSDSNNRVYIRVTVPQGWIGNITDLTFNFGANPN
jgi:hypothetical protein